MHMLCRQLLREGGRAFPSCQLSRFVLWEGVLLHLALLQTGGVEQRGSKWARKSDAWGVREKVTEKMGTLAACPSAVSH